MGSDMAMNPPPRDVFVLLTNTSGKGAIYRYQPMKSHEWQLVQRLGDRESQNVAKAFSTVHIQHESTLTPNPLPEIVRSDTMRQILNRRSEERRVERERVEELATLKQLRERYPDA